jgi:hypothetical protein
LDYISATDENINSAHCIYVEFFFMALTKILPLTEDLAGLCSLKGLQPGKKVQCVTEYLDLNSEDAR